VLIAALMWSTSGAFVKSLKLPEVTITVYRAGIAGATLLGLVLIFRRRVSFDRRMVAMALCFTLMNYWFMASMSRTTAANTLFLQYTAPLWMTLAGVTFLKEVPNRRSLVAVGIGMIGITILILGSLGEREGFSWGIGFGILSGLGYAGVAVFLRVLRHHDPMWLAAVNQLSAGAFAALYFGSQVSSRNDLMPPSGWTFVALAVFAVFQLALPYALFGWGLRSVSAQEAGVLTLLEPMLNPVWTFLAARELPSLPTMIGGVILTGALAAQIAVNSQKGSKNSAEDGRP
jgi:drug/metabolite transporter (DMT)-like permease